MALSVSPTHISGSFLTANSRMSLFTLEHLALVPASLLATVPIPKTIVGEVKVQPINQAGLARSPRALKGEIAVDHDDLPRPHGVVEIRNDFPIAVEILQLQLASHSLPGVPRLYQFPHVPLRQAPGT